MEEVGGDSAGGFLGRSSDSVHPVLDNRPMMKFSTKEASLQFLRELQAEQIRMRKLNATLHAILILTSNPNGAHISKLTHHNYPKFRGQIILQINWSRSYLKSLKFLVREAQRAVSRFPR